MNYNTCSIWNARAICASSAECVFNVCACVRSARFGHALFHELRNKFHIICVCFGNMSPTRALNIDMLCDLDSGLFRFQLTVNMT